MVVEITEQTDLAGDLANMAHQLETLQESYAALELAREDTGWNTIRRQAEEGFTREGLRQSAHLCRVIAIANPLLKRGINLRAAYVWGSGATITARATGTNENNPAEQDVNTIIQTFLDSDDTRHCLMSATARARNERTLATDGNLFVALWTHPTGAVRPRLIPFDEINEVITNPEDRHERWFYLRQWQPAGQSRKQSALYPAVGYNPAQRPETYETATGQVPIMWDAPIAAMSVNALDTWDYGIGDAYASLPWARAYADLLNDWARLFKALSRIAFRAGAPKSAVAKQAQAAHQAATLAGQAGGTVHLGPDQTLEAVPKTGAIIDADSGRPVAAMVAAGLDVPVTMLLTDPGVTGSRATAETLDKPTELMASTRRDEWADFLRVILGHVIDASARAGVLRAAKVERVWDRETITLAGETDRTIEIVWPDLTETSVNDQVAAITDADSTGKLPPLEVAKLLMHALGVDDADEILSSLTDDNGVWVDPLGSAGDAAVRRFRDGQNPADVL